MAWLLILLGSAGIVASASFSSGENTSAETTEVWSHQAPNLSSTDLRFRDVDFINATHGWIVGEDCTGIYGGVVLSTTDAGDSWRLRLNGSSPHYGRICIVDSQVIWVTGRGALFCTLDSGRTWNKSAVVDTESGMSTVEFVNRTHGWTATMGTLYMTTDGGESWEEVPGWSFSGDVPRDMHFSPAAKVWAIGFFGIYYSTDGGETWGQRFNRGGRAFSFVDDIGAWAVGNSLLALMTSDGVWTERPLPGRAPLPPLTPPYLTDVRFWDENHGWIVGGATSGVHVMYTPSGGRDWGEQECPPNSSKDSWQSTW